MYAMLDHHEVEQYTISKRRTACIKQMVRTKFLTKISNVDNRQTVAVVYCYIIDENQSISIYEPMKYISFVNELHDLKFMADGFQYQTQILLHQLICLTKRDIVK